MIANIKIMVLWVNLLPLFSRYKSEKSSVPKLEAASSPKILVMVSNTILHHFPEDGNLHVFCFIFSILWGLSYI
jgi:hypothetical protein